MKSLLRVAVVVLAWLAFQPAMAQQHTFRYRDDVKVIIDSDTLKHPWVGGLNSPVFSRIDLDLDGTEDLFAFDRSHQKIYTFLARRQQGTWQWQYAPAYEYRFPRDLDGWVLLRDYDRDGRRDLFTKTAIGIKVYRNTSTAAAGLGFTEAEPYLKFNNTINLQVSSENLPFIGDLDQDGDLDILTFDFASSSTIEYYQNLQADQSLPANRFQFTLASPRWGGLMRCHSHECHAYVFHAACRTEGTRHNEGTTLSALDLDGDGDRDLLLGGESCPELARISNSGTPAEGRLAGADLLLSFPENSTPAILPYFPASYHEDLNFDGLADLLVAPFARTNTGDDIDFSRSAWFYQNEGSHSQPWFTLRQRDFLQHDMIDAGEQSAPALADLDGDGDQDLLAGTRPGRIWFFRNVGTRTKAAFHLESRDYQQLSVAGFRDLKLQLSDLNGDGRPDLVLAGSTATGGAIAYIPNAAPLGREAIFPRDQFKTLSVPAGRPAFYDLDGDGDKDLVLAPALPASGSTGMLQFYRNTGSRSEPFFELEQEKLGGIAADFRRRNPYPLLADLNRDNKSELLLADDTGELRIYSHIADNLEGTWEAVTEVFPLPGGETPVSLQLGGSITLAAADLDGDRIPEIVAGSQGGGLVLLGQESADTPPLEELSLRIYPNPARGWFRVESREEVIVFIRNAAGQLVKESGSTFRKLHEIEVQDLATGLYLVQVRTAANRLSNHKLVVTD